MSNSAHTKTLKPVNRHLTIVPHFTRKETPNGVLLPETYRPEEDRYVLATVVDVSLDCNRPIREWRSSLLGDGEIIVDRSMIEEVKVLDKTYYMVLENHVVGFVHTPG